MKVRSFHEASEKLAGLRKISGLSTVSFDVFDTLIHRRCAPEVIDRATARVLASLSGVALDEVMAARSASRAILHDEAERRGSDRDVLLSRWCESWVHRIACDQVDEESLAREVCEAEIAHEVEACFANPVMLAACRSLKSRGFRLIFTSDMYLGEEAVRRILDAHGYADLFDAGYVSGDWLLTKHSGRLFDVVLEKEGLSPRDLLHVGDNPHSDGAKASERGLRTLVVGDPRTSSRIKALAYDAERAFDDRSWRGVLAAGFAGFTPFESPSEEEAIGRIVFGPVIASFVHALAERCAAAGVDRIYFLSREGMVLKKAYEAIAPNVLPRRAPEAAYLSVSRLATMMAATESFGLREAYLTCPNGGSLRKMLLPAIGGDEALLDDLAGRYGFGADEHVECRVNPAFHLLVRDPALSRAMRDNKAVHRDRLLSHLRERGVFDCRRIALVDVGWGGQIQENLELALAGIDGAPEIEGFYLGTNSLAEDRRRRGAVIGAAIADMTRFEWCGGSVFSFVEAFESACRAPHGTIMGYSGSTPIVAGNDLPSRAAEVRDDPTIAMLQKGIVEFASLYGACARFAGLSAGDTLGYARTVTGRLIRFPRKSEARILTSFGHCTNHWSQDSVTLGMKVKRADPRSWVRALRQSSWKEAVAGSIGGRVLQFAVAVLRTQRQSASSARPNVVIPSRMEPTSPVSLPKVAPQPLEEASDKLSRQMAHDADSSAARATMTGALNLTELALMRTAWMVGNGLRELTGRSRIPADLVAFRNLAARRFPGLRRGLNAVRRIKARL